MKFRTIALTSLLAFTGLAGAVAYAATPAGTTSTPNTTGSETVDGALSKASGAVGKGLEYGIQLGRVIFNHRVEYYRS